MNHQLCRAFDGAPDAPEHSFPVRPLLGVFPVNLYTLIESIRLLRGHALPRVPRLRHRMSFSPNPFS
jgi:hypothetical protein